jgi:hypothetical protein
MVSLSAAGGGIVCSGVANEVVEWQKLDVGQGFPVARGRALKVGSVLVRGVVMRCLAELALPRRGSSRV